MGRTIPIPPSNRTIGESGKMPKFKFNLPTPDWQQVLQVAILLWLLYQLLY